jgi:NADPH2:quinone reductase
MKAIRFEATGGASVLALKDIELPPLADNQIRIRHSAIGINFIDIYHRKGLYPVPLPSGLGLEAAGIVVAKGAKVSHLKEGDRVGYCSGPIGAYAEDANVPADRVVAIPSSIPDDIAAAVMLKGMTAQYLLKRTYPVKRGETILFHAAAGGVGQIACQWAKHLGATVIGTVGNVDKIGQAKTNGCDHVIVPKTDDIAKRVRELTGGKGVPVVYDSVGKDTVMASLDSLSVRGLFVTFGNASGPVPPLEPALLSQKGSLYMTRPTLFHYTTTKEELQETANDLFAVLASGAVRVAKPTKYPLAEAAKAQSDLESRKTTGSLVLIP